MAKFIEWYSNHNTIVIQSLAVLIALSICVLLFRVFFVAQAGDGSGNTHSQLDGLEEKINKILESGSAGSSGGASSLAEIESMRSEIYNLRQALKEKENGGAAAGSVSAQTASSDGTLTPAAAGGGTLTSDDLKKYQKQIDELNGRLAEYELIAEDIADLHKLREENQKLKAQVGSGGGGPASDAISLQSAATTTAAPVDDLAALFNEDVSAEPVIETANVESPVEVVSDYVAVNAAVNLDGEAQVEQSMNEAEALLASVLETPLDAPVAAVNPAAELPPDVIVDAAVTETDKNLLSEFEKKNSTPKGS